MRRFQTLVAGKSVHAAGVPDDVSARCRKAAIWPRVIPASGQKRPCGAATGDARRGKPVDVGLVGGSIVIREVVTRGAGQAACPRQEARHLGARDDPPRAEASGGTATGDAGCREAVDGGLMGRVLVIGEGVRRRCGQIERAHQEARHLIAGDEVIRTEPSAGTAARDLGLAQPLDVGRERMTRRVREGRDNRERGAACRTAGDERAGERAGQQAPMERRT